jgi:hypothetical protein
MSFSAAGLTLLSAMITPAVLISASGTLILSTSNRLARIVDRLRQIGRALEALATDGTIAFKAERRQELDRQLAFYGTRGQLIQRALTSLYLSLGCFVGTTVCIGIASLLNALLWLPTVLGILGTLVLFYGCVLLIAVLGMTSPRFLSLGSVTARRLRNPPMSPTVRLTSPRVAGTQPETVRFIHL